MRIITGSARGVRLETLEGEEVTRPTAERVKEAIFSAIQFETEGRRVLDLFGGSGQMGLEALSRGARSCMFVDASEEAIAVIKRNAQKTRLSDTCRYLISDYRNYLRKARGREKFDLVFLDPPYAMHAHADALKRLLDGDLVEPDCLFICESSEPDIFGENEALASRFHTRKTARYTHTYIHILTLREEEDDENGTHQREL
ncbi:MAG: 16S rRNA (guanine(966)-N(2))-methyltransferase RsmD [Clostridia bacterium]|nr:16S rRNA (guanine(966)-N(2))-methyltransferase RsmD [Clostridia bacterium]